VDHGTWIKVGYGLKAGLKGNDGGGFRLFDEWSRGSSKYDKKQDTRWTWRSLRPRADGAGAGSIYAMAEANGWKPPFGMILNGNMAEAVAAGFGGDPELLARAAERRREARSDSGAGEDRQEAREEEAREEAPQEEAREEPQEQPQEEPREAARKPRDPLAAPSAQELEKLALEAPGAIGRMGPVDGRICA
jgi:hypothetical protein